MDKTDQLLKQRLQSSAAQILPPKTGRYHLIQAARQAQQKARGKLPRTFDLVEYEQIHGQGLAFLSLNYPLQPNTIGLFKLV